MRLYMNTIQWLLLLMFLPTLSWAKGADDSAALVEQVYTQLKPKFKDAVEIDVEQLVKGDEREKQSLVLVDVRESPEQNVSIIPGAITMKDFQRSPERYRNAKLIAYCTIGYRSGKFAIKWRKKGYNIHNLKGGVLAWAHAGQLFQTPSGFKTKRVHVYEAEWSLLPGDYIPVW